MLLRLNDKVQYVKGVGPALARKFRRLGISTISDLLYYFPRAYEDRRNLKLLRNAKEGERTTFRVQVIEHSTFFYRGRRHPKIKVTDKSGYAYLYCFNREYITNLLKVGTWFFLTGTFVVKHGIRTFSQFDYEISDDSPGLRILPIYPLTAGLSQKTLRRLIEHTLVRFSNELQEDIPEVIRKGYKLREKSDLIKQVHFPEDMASLRRAKESLSYSEFFKYQIVVALARDKNLNQKKERRTLEKKKKDGFLKALPFQLTDAQKRVVSEIETDLAEPRPMNRLIQGDVGCGKTIVALAAAVEAIEGGGQVAFMAPTEILARQHFNTIQLYFEPLHLIAGFLSGSVKGLERKEMLLSLLKGEIDILVGTHALFSEDVAFRDLSLVIIDEQQKFGVMQRGRLRAKGDNPDCIVMSATPIPRTLTMTLYGDLDLSIIDEMPKGRREVKTIIVKQAEIEKAFDKVRQEVEKGRQAYFVYPLIEESMSSDLKNALESYERLKEEVFKELRVGLLHGKMSDQEKEEVMLRFKKKECDILVSTSVVEVGVDVPNATIMVIEQAERFGLSSIHQLRGRIGRGSYESFCFLVPDRSTGYSAYSRLNILKDTHDGFKIAEWDLKLRGPGEIVGKKQSGIPSFIIDDLDINTRLIYRAHKDARMFVKGELGDEQERERYLAEFVKSDSYKDAFLYFGG